MSPVSPLEDVVALAQKALSASKQAALLSEDSETVSSNSLVDSLSTRFCFFNPCFVYVLTLFMFFS